MFSNRKIILVILLLSVICISAYVLLVFIPTRMAERSYEGARRIGKDLREAFNFTPQITVNNTVVLQQETPIAELATLSQRFRHEYVWTNTWAGSTKKIHISGTFEAKAGFDFNKKFTIEITDESATVVFPEPELLSISSLHDLRFKDENGIWNWVNQSDRTRAINAFTANAQDYARTAPFVSNAKKAAEEKIVAVLKNHVKEVDISFGDGDRKNYKFDSPLNQKD